MSGDIKSVLYAWLGTRKKTPVYEIEPAGSKQRLRFMCKVCLSIIITECSNKVCRHIFMMRHPVHGTQLTTRKSQIVLANELRYYWLYLLVHIHVHVPVS